MSHLSTKRPDRDVPAARTFSGLAVKRRARAHQPYQTHKQEDDRKAKKGQRDGEGVVERALEHAIPGIATTTARTPPGKTGAAETGRSSLWQVRPLRPGQRPAAGGPDPQKERRAVN